MVDGAVRATIRYRKPTRR
jgi:tripartite-type tricarboxylate transporter receptor subunit TctC